MPDLAIYAVRTDTPETDPSYHLIVGEDMGGIVQDLFVSAGIERATIISVADADDGDANASAVFNALT